MPDDSSFFARLATYTDFPQNCIKTPETLAGAGFTYHGFADEVECKACNLAGGLWTDGHMPLHIHLRYGKPALCPFIKAHEAINSRVRNLTADDRIFSKARVAQVALAADDLFKQLDDASAFMPADHKALIMNRVTAVADAVRALGTGELTMEIARGDGEVLLPGALGLLPDVAEPMQDGPGMNEPLDNEAPENGIKIG